MKYDSQYRLLIIISIALMMNGALPEHYGAYHFLSATIFFITLPIIALATYYREHRNNHLYGLFSLIMGVLALIELITFFLVKLDIMTGIRLGVPEILSALPSSI
ncbi:MAG: hypothetical protein B6U89_01375 [Desulfurococcales archaeon ex4484_58]|nr:MAG: hypothetical protein B6U89_01375 [Desulfurococcales archaeon ex4484_58]